MRYLIISKSKLTINNEIYDAIFGALKHFLETMAKV